MNPADASSQRSDYKDHARNLGGATWIKQDSTSNVATLTFLTLSNSIDVAPVVRPWVFLLVENENDQRDIIAHATLQTAARGESVYEEILLTMQIAIRAL